VSMSFSPGAIFSGVRIADFSWVIAAPLATQYLAIHGADVIRIESSHRLDTLRNNLPMINGIGPDHCPYYGEYNMGKRAIRLNLRRPRAVDLARTLVAGCDAVVENFTPGTLARLGLGYDRLCEVRPDLVMLSMALGGQTGPESSFKGFGTVIQGAAGITHLTGWPDRDPVGTGVAYTDFFAGPVAASVLLAALMLRRDTGRGQHIDLSQQEASMYALDAALLQQTVNGQSSSRQGNRHPSAAPHGVYPCAGDDRWLAIAVFTDAHWQGLLEALGRPAWAEEPRFATFLGRKAHEDDLDAQLGAWTITRDGRDAMAGLQRHGVPAGMVEDARDLLEDPQLADRGHFVQLPHPAIGPFPMDSLPYRLNGLQPLPERAGPCLGQDNAAIFQDLLGLSAGEYAELEADGVFE
jgi:benzylsuccinate CoA-transferase BbsF subunit